MEIQRFGVQILVLYFDYNISQRITFGNNFFGTEICKIIVLRAQKWYSK